MLNKYLIMVKKSHFIFIILLSLININLISAFKYPINKDLLSSEKGEISSIEIESKSDLDKYIINNKYVIAIFHADWCGHCKRFLPIFDEVSKYLIISQTWKLLKIPCSKYEKICDSFNVEGYPTIKLFKDSQEIKDLFVPREKETFLEFLLKMTKEPLIYINNINNTLQEFYDNYGTFSPLIKYNKNKTEFINCIKDLAYNKEFLSEYYFGVIEDKEDKIIFNYDNNNVIFNYKGNCEEIKIFLRNNKYPLISEANFNIMRKMNRDNIRYICIMFYFYNNDIINNFVENEYKNISKDNREIVFTYSLYKTKNQVANYFQIELNKETEFQILIFDFYKEKFYKHPIYDINNISLNSVKDDIIKLIKNLDKIKFTSNNKINNFVSDHKILLITLLVILVLLIIYLVLCCDLEDEGDVNKLDDKKERQKEIRQLINKKLNFKDEDIQSKTTEIIKKEKEEKKEKDENIKEKQD